MSTRIRWDVWAAVTGGIVYAGTVRMMRTSRAWGLL
jgi:hypothetical protein